MDGDRKPALTVADDYSWVKWPSGISFHFSDAMRDAIEQLCKDYLAGRPSTDGKTLLRLSNAPSVEKLFKARIEGRLQHHPCWGRMVVRSESRVQEAGIPSKIRVKRIPQSQRASLRDSL
jgi:hypothetical protein